jgi:putative FmdB family regulatory protein
MPIFEYKCAKCGAVTALLENRKKWNFWRRKCSRCGSKRLKRIFSPFATAKKQSMADLVGEMKRLGPVNFVPSPPPAMQGPPPGGCPYCQPEKKEKQRSKKK